MGHRVDQVHGLRRVPVAVVAAMTAIAAAWAFWPLDHPGDGVSGQTDLTEPTGSSPGSEPAALPLAAFGAPLWVAPPAPPPPPPPAPEPAPPPPLKLQLLAVVNQNGHYEAVVFDPDANKVYSVGEGETVGIGTVERIDAMGVDLRDKWGTRTLALNAGGPSNKPATKGGRR